MIASAVDDVEDDLSNASLMTMLYEMSVLSCCLWKVVRPSFPEPERHALRRRDSTLSAIRDAPTC